MSVAYPRKLVRWASAAACLASAVALMASGTPAAAASLVPTNQITLPGGQRILTYDISFIDPVIGLYVFADRTNKTIDVFNTRTQTLVSQAAKGQFKGQTSSNNTSGPDGVLIANHKEIWAGDGNSTIKTILLSNPTVVTHTISTGGQNRVDEMCFDPVHQRVMAANNADDPPFATIFNVTTHSIAHQIFFNGQNGTLKATNGAEQCVWSPRTQKFIQTLPGVHTPDDGTGAVVEIDPVSGMVLSNVIIPVGNCNAPQGQAVGPGSQILVGCNGGAPGGPSVIIDDGSGGNPFGTILATVPNQAGPDMVDFNGATNQYTLAKSTRNPQAVGIIDAGSFTSGPDLISNPLGPGGGAIGSIHSIASDKGTGLTFLPVSGLAAPTLCGSVGGNNTQGCILILKTQ